MNYLQQSLMAIVFLSLSFSCLEAMGQNNNSSFTQTYELVQEAYGLDQVLINGVYYENIYKNDLGFPFFQTDEFLSGYVVIHNRKYSDNLSFKYNIYNQSLVVMHTDKAGDQLVYMPSLVFISEFGLNKLVFRKYQFEDSPPQFYQEVYSGQIKCLYAWSKNGEESNHNGRFVAFKFFEAKHKSFLVIENKLCQYRSKASFVKLFQEENKKLIKGYIKEHKVKLTKSSDQEMAALVLYCESIVNSGSSSFETNMENK
jgi:hypothetical protein